MADYLRGGVGVTGPLGDLSSQHSVTLAPPCPHPLHCVPQAKRDTSSYCASEVRLDRGRQRGGRQEEEDVRRRMEGTSDAVRQMCEETSNRSDAGLNLQQSGRTSGQTDVFPRSCWSRPNTETLEHLGGGVISLSHSTKKEKKGA